MKIIIFGATGYLGRHIVANLAAHGHDLSGFSRNAANDATLQAMGVRAVRGDLARIDSIPAMLDGQDVVIFAAQLMLEHEKQVTQTIVDHLAGSGKAFIFTSGTSLMSIPTGGLWDERSFAEDEPFEPKRQIAPRLINEAIARDSAKQGVRGMVIRPSLIWGNGGSQIIADLYHSARTTGAVCHVGRGLNVYSNIHVEELAEIYRLAIEKGEAGALYFAVSGEVAYGVMAQRIAQHLGVSTRSVTVEEACDIWDKGLGKIILQSNSRQRCPRTRTQLGWSPREDRVDILEDCLHPDYAAATERAAPSWVAPRKAVS
ncbi:NAD-dependent epimerase/dehydratase family protein [Sphingobium sp.]|uniref:NAD-dependent epimerase/dehydratase family protein n=1 Tax=Sphingobium sp. TaxID=1912891 RepID=UPI00262C2E7B|nr:NAD-dependent epimerase/dehydratase family protein [Sphingobium sp.]